MTVWMTSHLEMKPPELRLMSINVWKFEELFFPEIYPCLSCFDRCELSSDICERAKRPQTAGLVVML